jgi:hypothetical protein
VPSDIGTIARFVHICTASCIISLVSPSRHPPLILLPRLVSISVSASVFITYLIFGPPDLCITRHPHVLQKRHSRVLPLSVGRLYTPSNGIGISKLGNMAEMPNAEDDWWRHSKQWQTKMANGFSVGVLKLMAPHWQWPCIIVILLNNYRGIYYQGTLV